MMDTQQILTQIAQHPLKLTPTGAKGCTHYTVSSGNKPLACTCNLAPLVDLLNKINALASDAAKAPGADPAEEPTEKPAVTESDDEARPAPTLALLANRPRPTAPVQAEKEPDWELTTTARASIARHGFTFQQVYDTVAYPYSTTPHSSHATSGLTYYHAEPVTVLYNDVTHTFVDVYKYDQSRVSPGKMRVPGQKTQKRAPTPTTQADLLALLSEHGFTVTQGGKHLKVTHPESTVVYTIPSTPSDYRSIANTVSQVRKWFGIDLRA